MRVCLAAFVVSALTSAAVIVHGQAPAALPTFEVASVKRNTTGPNPAGVQFLPNGVNILNIQLRAIIQIAYQIPQPSRIIGGPQWVYNDRFDITARTAGSHSPEVMRTMLQTVLAERFALVARKEMRAMPGYALMPLNNTGNQQRPGLRVSTTECGAPAAGGAAPAAGAPAPCGPRPGGPGRLLLVGVTIQQFAGLLALVVGESVVDRTGLTDRYDIDLSFQPERRAPGPPDAALDDRPSLFTAVQEQLGLRLSAAPQEVEVVVIDSVLPPTAD